MVAKLLVMFMQLGKQLQGLSAEYSFDFSSTLPYRKGQVLSNEGKYKIKLTDELGNF